MASRTLRYVPLDELRGNPANPKGHLGELIGASLDRFGLVEPQTMDGRTGLLSAGHGRLKELKAKQDEGEPPPDGVRVKAGKWLVPVVFGWESANDEEALAYLVASNQSTIAGGWDLPALGAALDQVRHTDLELAGTGHTTQTLDDLLASLAPVAIDVGPPEDAPPQPDGRERDDVEHRVKPGDVWQLGPHRVACGSCTDVDAVGALLAGVVPAMLVTDPPYSSGGWQEAGKAAGSIGTRHADGSTPTIANDRLSTRGYMALMSAMLNAAPTEVLYVFTDWRMWVNLFDVVEASGFGVRSMIVWDKGSPGMGRGWRSQHELILHGAKAKIAWDNHAAVGNVVQLPRTGNPLHPTQKPVELLERVVGHTPGDTVYDPFAGSGSVTIAADLCRKVSYSMELDPGYCDVILDRWERHGGAAPVKVDG